MKRWTYEEAKIALRNLARQDATFVFSDGGRRRVPDLVSCRQRGVLGDVTRHVEYIAFDHVHAFVAWIEADYSLLPWQLQPRQDLPSSHPAQWLVKFTELAPFLRGELTPTHETHYTVAECRARTEALLRELDSQ